MRGFWPFIGGVAVGILAATGILRHGRGRELQFHRLR